MNRFIIILAIAHFSIAFALENTTSTAQSPIKNTSNSSTDTTQPNTVAFDIITNTLSSLKALKKQNNASVENVETLIKTKLLPSIAIDVSTELALKKHWNTITPEQRMIFQKYLAQSLIKNYGIILSSYDNLEQVKVEVDPNIKRKDNKAIVGLVVRLNNKSEPVNITLKMIKSNQWHVYDMAFSGVSLVSNYAAQFDSHIKRKGVDSLIDSIVEKTK